MIYVLFFFHYTATTEIYTYGHTLSLHDALPSSELVVLNKFDKRGAEDALRDVRKQWKRNRVAFQAKDEDVPVYPTIASQFNDPGRSEEHTSELQSLMRISYAVFCLKKIIISPEHAITLTSNSVRILPLAT